MSPSIITEANQPLSARSTVAQRKQANELRKVRTISTTLPSLVFTLWKRSPINRCSLYFLPDS